MNFDCFDAQAEEEACENHTEGNQPAARGKCLILYDEFGVENDDVCVKHDERFVKMMMFRLQMMKPQGQKKQQRQPVSEEERRTKMARKHIVPQQAADVEEEGEDDDAALVAATVAAEAAAAAPPRDLLNPSGVGEAIRAGGKSIIKS